MKTTERRPVVRFLSMATALSVALVTAAPAIAADNAEDAVLTSAVTASADAVTKDETAYVFLNSDGSVQNQIVTDWLHSDSSLGTAKDKSSLSGITVLKGDATVEQTGEDLTWNSEEKDLYYQGTSAGTPPVSASISWTLDGTKMSAEDLDGKSGHLVITIDLTNNETVTRTIGGEQREIATPFAAVVALDLPSSCFSNVTAEHGTIGTDTSNQLVGFITLPGVRKSLDGLLTGELSSLNDVLLDSVTVEADVTGFEMPTVLLAASTSVKELKDLPDWSGISGKLDDLTDGTQKLADAVKELDTKMSDLQSGYDTFDSSLSDALTGAQALQTGSSSVASGAQSVADGAAALTEGSSALSDRLNSELVPQLAEASALQSSLVNDMNTLNAKITALKSGSVTIPSEVQQQVSSTVTPAVESAFGTVASVAGAAASSATVDAIAGSLNTEIAGYQTQYSQAVAAAQAYAKAGDTANAATYQAAAQQLAVVISTLQATVQTISGSKTDPAAAAAVTKSVTAAVGSSTEVSNAAASVSSAVGSAFSQAAPAVVSSVTGSLQTDLDKVNTESSQLLGGMTKLTGALYNAADPSDQNTVAGAAGAISAGAAELSAGADQLRDGTAGLNTGVNSLTNGLAQLCTASGSIRDGITQFGTGTGKLLDGANELNTAVQKIRSNETVEKLPSIREAVTAMKEQADAYTSYTGTADGSKAAVRFIMKVVPAGTSSAASADAAATSSSASDPTKSDTTFLERIRNLFA